MTRPTHALINWSNFRHNYTVAKKLADGDAYAVVKANGYGHGIVACASALSDADGFSVACVDEGVLLRKAGIQRPVLVLQGAYNKQEWQLAGQHQLLLVVHHAKQIEDAIEAKIEKPVSLYLKINSGMNRLGFRVDQIDDVVSKVANIDNLNIAAVMTHFATADDLSSQKFTEQLSYLMQRDWQLPLSLCNSAALYHSRQLKGKKIIESVSRPGIMLYGSSPLLDKTAHELGLKPVMSLRSKLISIHTVAEGETVSYGEQWQAERDSVIGVVAVGYGDGYPRHAPVGTPIWVDGKICPLVGRVTMDMVMVDLTKHPQAEIGSLVELWGEHVSVDEIAKRVGTISYELFCQVTPRVPRISQSQA